VAVVGVPDPEWGEQPVAAVVCRPGTNATEAEIRAAAREAGLARFKCPTLVDFVAELPRNAIGKIQKGLLRERYRAIEIARRPATDPGAESFS
jgi:acyl-CoA synthetase (AMP-forming)/AMP-acid ligase II